MVSRFMSWSPTSGSVLTAQSLEPASDTVSPSLSAPPLLVLSFSEIKLKNVKKSARETVWAWGRGHLWDAGGADNGILGVRLELGTSFCYFLIGGAAVSSPP